MDKNSVLVELVESYRSEYAQLAEDWRAIETKAQASITVCGILIGGVFLFLREFRLEMNAAQKSALAGATVLLGIAVAFSIAALWVRTYPRPPLGDDAKELTDDVLRIREEDWEEAHPRWLRDRIAAWQPVNNRLHEIVAGKARRVFLGQCALVGALALVMALSLWVLFRGVRP
jgi:hypothetical protein